MKDDILEQREGWVVVNKEGFCRVDTSNNDWIKHLQDNFKNYKKED